MGPGQVLGYAQRLCYWDSLGRAEGMGRLIFWGLVAFLLWRWWSRRRPAVVRAPQALREGTMCQCDHCGVYFPVEEAVQAGPRHYCCPAHRLADEARGR